jgi:Na+-translocating ferredoxin:NAD+ oxidoreductase subunit B
MDAGMRDRMTEEIYYKLRHRLDQYFLGFPATESGVELRVLAKLFSDEDAEVFVAMTLQVETAEQVAARLGRDPAAMAERLESMAERGLLFRSKTAKGVKYGAVPFLPGIWEFQLATMDREFAELLDQYNREALLEARIEGAALFMRTVPVNRSVVVTHHIAPYEDAREIIRNAKTIALAECICRKERRLVGQGCDKPLEVCFLMGSTGQYYLDRGMGRRVEAEEAIRVLEQAQEAGLVTQLSTSQNPSGMCNCCGDCCVVLGALNKDPKPGKRVFSNYFAVVDPERCTGCEVCIERCQMGAVGMNDSGTAQINLDRCIGCGLCAGACPAEAMSLEVKPERERRTPPATPLEQTAAMARKRGIPLASLLPG